MLTSNAPSIPITFSHNLLSTPSFSYNVESLKIIADWIIHTVYKSKFKRFEHTKVKILLKYLEFVDLYEKVKQQEKESKEKSTIKANMFGYRPKLVNRNDQNLFERLERRSRSYKKYR